MMQPVTDPELLVQLNAPDDAFAGMQPVTDPELLAQLNAPDSTMDWVSQQLMQGVKDIPSNVSGVIRGAGESIVNFPSQVLNMLLPKNMQLRLLNTAENGGFPYEIGKLGGELATFGGGATALGAARKAAESLPAIGQAARALGGAGYLPTIGRVGAGSGAYGAVMSPEDRLKGAMESALVGGAIGGLGKGIPQAFDKLLNPLSGVKGRYSPQEVARNIEAAQGTETALGDIIGSPELKRKFDIELPKNIKSGVEESMKETANEIVSRGNKILDKYLGNYSPYEVSDQLGNALTKAFNKQRQLKNSLYKEAEDLSQGLNLKTPEFESSVSKYKDAIENSELLKYEPENRAILNRLANYRTKPEKSSLIDASGNQIPSTQAPTLKEANILASKLNELSKMHASSPEISDRYQATIFKDLGKSLKNDIKNSIESSNNPNLKEAFHSAEKNYKEQFSPFLDKEIYQFISGKKSPEDLVSSFIVTGKATDKGNKLNKLMSKLSPEEQNLVKYSYFARALKGDEGMRYVDPLIFRNLLSERNLGSTQKRALIPDKAERQLLENYSRLAGMNTEALTRMFIPKTGMRSAIAHSSLPDIASGLAGYAASGGSMPVAILSALGRKLAKNITDKRAVRRLTSEQGRRDYLRNANLEPYNPDAALLNAISQVLLKP